MSSSSESSQLRLDRRGGFRAPTRGGRQQWIPREPVSSNSSSTPQERSQLAPKVSSQPKRRSNSIWRDKSATFNNHANENENRNVNRVEAGSCSNSNEIERGHFSVLKNSPEHYDNAESRSRASYFKRKGAGRSYDNLPRTKHNEQAEISDVPLLAQEIQEKIMKGVVECMICYDTVGRSAPIWSCSSCYVIFHLNCIKKWARAPTSSDSSAEKGQGLNWRCPGCQSVQLVLAKDIRYVCFCGKRNDPESDFYFTPHSCGEPCGKPLERKILGGLDNDDIRCPHVCVLPCHPGPCPPCKAFAPPYTCPCGKKTITRRCADKKSSSSCGQICDKLLECGRHQCDRICHVGPCDPCNILINAPCFCNGISESILCGDMPVKGELNGINGFFSCNMTCDKKLDCGNHDCKMNCHPGPCGGCKLLPKMVKTCCCGKTDLRSERNSCLDPIPTCSRICEKFLPCGKHRCQERCHEGDCAPCQVIVNQKCRCQHSSRMIECYKTMEDTNVFLCEKQCGRKKNCGRHRCSEKCCPLSNSNSNTMTTIDVSPHLCMVVCGKRLRCGQHSCESLCHAGHCLPCLETIFTDLTCACGKTSIPPPLPCGTPPPSCLHPCSIVQPCGHSTSHVCHFGDCPPCSIPVAKECVGGHVMLRNIPCGSKDIRCNQLCGKTRQCGLHACKRLCHPPPCDASCGSNPSTIKPSCGQTCGAPRRDCKHTCASPCHPLASCPDLRCEVPVPITCSCGRMTATVPCDAGGVSSDSVFEASIIHNLPAPLIQVEVSHKKIPLGQRKLACNEDCAKMERNRLLAEAFDITTPNLDGLQLGDSVARDVVAELFRREPKWILAIEERFKCLVMGKTKNSSASGLRVHVFCPVVKEKRDVVRFMAERWKLAIHCAGWEPKRFVVVHVTQKSKPPTRILGAKGVVPINGYVPPIFDPAIDMDPRVVVSLFDLPRDVDITSLVLRFGGECELVWLNDKNALAVFGDPLRTSTALRRLDHGSPYHGAVSVHSNIGTISEGVKDGGSTMKDYGWKRAIVQSSSWAGDEPLDVVNASSWKPKVVAPPMSVQNRWDILDKHESVHHQSNLSAPFSPCAESQIQVEAKVEQPEAVDDWEEAYE